MKEETKKRFKSHWKKLVVGLISVGAVLYFIFTGKVVDPTPIIEFLK